VVRDLVYWVCHNCIGDCEVPDPHLVEHVAVSVCGCLPPQGGYKPGYGQECVQLLELAIQVPSYDDLCACILPDDILGQVDHRLSPFNDSAFLPGLQVDIQDVHLLLS